MSDTLHHFKFRQFPIILTLSNDSDTFRWFWYFPTIPTLSNDSDTFQWLRHFPMILTLFNYSDTFQIWHFYHYDSFQFWHFSASPLLNIPNHFQHVLLFTVLFRYGKEVKGQRVIIYSKIQKTGTVSTETLLKNFCKTKGIPFTHSPIEAKSLLGKKHRNWDKCLL